MTNPHIVVDPEDPRARTFKSDKYAWCPPGFVPLKVTDPMAKDVLLLYALRRREVDRDFSDALVEVLGLPSAYASQASPLDHMAEAHNMVGAERARQIMQEDWSLEHDDLHDSGQLARAAAAYCEASSHYDERSGVLCNGERDEILMNVWPWDEAWFKPKSPIRDLIRAGALVLAEIERRLRAGEEA